MPIVIPGAQFDLGKVYADTLLRNETLQVQRAQNAAQIQMQERQLQDAREARMQDLAFKREEAQRQSGEAEKNRQYGTSERLGTQEFQGGQAGLQRAFTSSEAGKEREFRTGERLGGQEFQAGEAKKQRSFAQSEAEAQMAHQVRMQNLQQEFQKAQAERDLAFRAGDSQKNRELQKTLADLQHAITKEQLQETRRHGIAMEGHATAQLGVQKSQGDRDYELKERQLTNEHRYKAAAIAQDLVSNALHANPNADPAKLYDHFYKGILQDMTGEAISGSSEVPSSVQSVEDQQKANREAAMKTSSRNQGLRKAVVGAAAEDLTSQMPGWMKYTPAGIGASAAPWFAANSGIARNNFAPMDRLNDPTFRPKVAAQMDLTPDQFEEFMKQHGGE